METVQPQPLSTEHLRVIHATTSVLQHSSHSTCCYAACVLGGLWRSSFSVYSLTTLKLSKSLPVLNLRDARERSGLRVSEPFLADLGLCPERFALRLSTAKLSRVDFGWTARCCTSNVAVLCDRIQSSSARAVTVSMHCLA